MGMKLVPAGYFSVLAATGFNAVPGIHLFYMKPEKINREIQYEK